MPYKSFRECILTRETGGFKYVGVRDSALKLYPEQHSNIKQSSLAEPKVGYIQPLTLKSPGGVPVVQKMAITFHVPSLTLLVWNLEYVFQAKGPALGPARSFSAKERKKK